MNSVKNQCTGLQIYTGVNSALRTMLKGRTSVSIQRVISRVFFYENVSFTCNLSLTFLTLSGATITGEAKSIL